MTTNTSGFTPSRRTLVKGAAWSVPVIAMAAPAHAACASNPDDCEECLQVTLGDNSCKYPDNKTYKLEICFTNNCNEGNLIVQVDRVVSNSGGYLPVPVNVTLTVPQGGRQCVYVEIKSDNMGNFQNVYFTIGGNAQMRQVPTKTWGTCDPTVPDVMNLTEEQARAAIVAAGLVPVVTYDPTAGNTGRVVSQDPAAGTSVSLGSSVTIVIAGEPPAGGGEDSGTGDAGTVAQGGDAPAEDAGASSLESEPATDNSLTVEPIEDTSAEGKTTEESDS